MSPKPSPREDHQARHRRRRASRQSRSRFTTYRPLWMRFDVYLYVVIAALLAAWFAVPALRKLTHRETPARVLDAEEAERVRQAKDRLVQGIALNRRGELDMAAECFKEALDLNRDDLEPHYWLMLYHEEKAKQGQQAGDAKEMLKHVMLSGFHARAIVPVMHTMIPVNQDFVAEAIYNESKGHMLLEDHLAALAALRLAVKCGYAQRAEIDGEPVFDPIRETREFQEIVNAIKPAAGQ